MRSGVVTLTTDFGADGPYVAAMKGVLLTLAPDARLVDVSHAIPPQDVRAAGFVLGQVVPYFPAGTVHLAVVDPGVGTARRIACVEAGGHLFVLPDNGLVTPCLPESGPVRAWSVAHVPGRPAGATSATFHGRDIMAPAAAFLVRVGDPADLGPAIPDLVRLDPPRAVAGPAGTEGEVVAVDHFGNLITNIAGHPGHRSARVAGREIPLVRTYGDRAAGEVVALVGSTGRVEVAVVNGSAADRLGLGRGAAVTLLSPPVEP